MFLSRKRIRRLLGIVNQTQRANKKRGRGLQNVNRTLRHKKPLNLRKRTIRYHKKKYKGGAGSGNNEEKIAMAIKLKEEKDTRQVKEDRLMEEAKMKPSAVFKYEIDEAGSKKLDEQIEKLTACLNEISTASEEATKRLTIITAVFNNLIDSKKDKDRDTNDKKLNKIDINSEIKRMSGLKSDLTKIISKYEIIKQTYTNDVNNIEKYKKQEYFEYTEPKSRISFYAATLDDFKKPYDKREGVNLIFPVYTSEPFFIETEYIGDAMVKKIKDGIKAKNGIFFHKYTNLDSNIIDMINAYNTKSDELVVKDTRDVNEDTSNAMKAANLDKTKRENEEISDEVDTYVKTDFLTTLIEKLKNIIGAVNEFNFDEPEDNQELNLTNQIENLFNDTDSFASEIKNLNQEYKNILTPKQKIYDFEYKLPIKKVLIDKVDKYEKNIIETKGLIDKFNSEVDALNNLSSGGSLFTDPRKNTAARVTNKSNKSVNKSGNKSVKNINVASGIAAAGTAAVIAAGVFYRYY